jgi:fluoride exporter
LAEQQSEIEPSTSPAGRRRPRGRVRLPVVLAVAAGGALGAPIRYELSVRVHVAPGSFPWSTFWINVSGSFLLGLLLTFMLERWPPTRYVRPFLAIGVLGAYTTFSTYSVETDLLFRDGHVAVGLSYALGSLAAGGVAVYLGIVAGRLWPLLRRSER